VWRDWIFEGHTAFAAGSQSIPRALQAMSWKGACAQRHLKAGVSRAVVALERKRLIRRRTDAADNRRQQLFLTDAGRTLYGRYIPALRAREEAMLACLSSTERRHFNRLLDKLAAHVPQWGSLSEL
jgi:MarR family transcriptional regulator, temperature-dependent positive regulator of motility